MVNQIELTPWTAKWRQAFEHARARDSRRLGQAREIEHVGSTAVVGLEAKPIVDVALGVTGVTDLEAVDQVLRNLGFVAIGDPMREQARFLQRSGDPPINLHLTVVGSQPWRDLIGFRDRMIADPVTAAGYKALKRRLAQASDGDLDVYTAGKSAFIGDALRAVR